MKPSVIWAVFAAGISTLSSSNVVAQSTTISPEKPLPLIALIVPPLERPQSGTAGAVLHILSGGKLQDEQSIGITYDLMRRPIKAHCGPVIVDALGAYVLIDYVTNKILHTQNTPACPPHPLNASILPINVDAVKEQQK